MFLSLSIIIILNIQILGLIGLPLSPTPPAAMATTAGATVAATGNFAHSLVWLGHLISELDITGGDERRIRYYAGIILIVESRWSYQTICIH
jgi:hypothetical protein